MPLPYGQTQIRSRHTSRKSKNEQNVDLYNDLVTSITKSRGKVTVESIIVPNEGVNVDASDALTLVEVLWIFTYGICDISIDASNEEETTIFP